LRTVLLALIDSLLVLGDGRSVDGVPVNGVEPIESIVVFPPVKGAVSANFLQVCGAEESIVDLNG